VLFMSTGKATRGRDSLGAILKHLQTHSKRLRAYKAQDSEAGLISIAVQKESGINGARLDQALSI